MIRLLIAFIVLTLLITYAILPLVKHIAKFGKKEIIRIDNSFNIDEKTKKEKVEE